MENTKERTYTEEELREAYKYGTNNYCSIDEYIDHLNKNSKNG